MTGIEDIVREYGLGVLQTGATCFFGWAVWSAKRVFVTHDRLLEVQKDLEADNEKLKGELGSVRETQTQRSARLDQLRQKLDTLPTVQAINDLALSVKAIEGDIKAINASMDGWKHATKRIERVADMITATGFEGLK
jgi:Protein of unknown function (DUF2730).